MTAQGDIDRATGPRRCRGERVVVSRKVRHVQMRRGRDLRKGDGTNDGAFADDLSGSACQPSCETEIGSPLTRSRRYRLEDAAQVHRHSSPQSHGAACPESEQHRRGRRR